MEITVGTTNSHKDFFLNCNSCNHSYTTTLSSFISKELPKILNLSSQNLRRSFDNGNIKFLYKQGIQAFQFKKSVGKVESGTTVFIGKTIEIVRGFPKIRRILMLSPSIKQHFDQEIAVEEKMNGYNVRIAMVDGIIVGLTRGGYICPYTTKKATELMDMKDFFKDHPELIICGEMVGSENPYVTHHYREIGKLGFRIFDLREKNSNKPLSIPDKIRTLKKYGLPSVELFGIFDVDVASENILNLVYKLGEEGREGVVIKDPEMKLEPIKYTSTQAHIGELNYGFTYPFDFGRDFFSAESSERDFRRMNQMNPKKR